jgi:hypothetical protein
MFLPRLAARKSHVTPIRSCHIDEQLPAIEQWRMDSKSDWFHSTVGSDAALSRTSHSARKNVISAAGGRKLAVLLYEDRAAFSYKEIRTTVLKFPNQEAARYKMRQSEMGILPSWSIGQFEISKPHRKLVMPVDFVKSSLFSLRRHGSR